MPPQKFRQVFRKLGEKAENQIEREVGMDAEQEILPAEFDEDLEKQGERPTSQPVAHKVDIGSYVQVVNGAFEGYYASVVAKSYGDEWELNYFMEKSSYQGKYWVLKQNDLDSREASDLAVVRGFPDAKVRFTFEDIQWILVDFNLPSSREFWNTLYTVYTVYPDLY